MRRYFKEVTQSVKYSSPILFAIASLCFVLAVVCGIGMIVDDRVLYDLNVWTKPFKFCISTGIYIMTIGYLITFYPYSERKKNIINNIVSWSLIVELGIIVYQGARGVQSHYNVSSVFDGLLFAVMGILVGVNVLVMVLFMIDTIRLRLRMPKSIQWGLAIGWFILLIGSWVGGQMISQMAHNVGAADGGRGLPLVNWSMVAGDLRVAHFFGLHGIQIIPLYALILRQYWKTPERTQIWSVILFGLLYGGWIAWSFYQAKQGIPLLGM